MASDFSLGTAFPDCAPWDGAAVRIQLGGSTAAATVYPLLTLSLWAPLPVTSGRRYVIDHGRVASASYCPKANGCEILDGSISVKTVAADGAIDGSYDLKARRGGKTFHGVFHAAWVQTHQACGG